MRRVLPIAVIVCLCSLFSTAVSRAQGFPLVKSGARSSQIFLGDNASPTEKYAAQELQRALEKISGAKLNIVTGAPGAPAVAIGTPQSMPAIQAANLFNTQNAEEVRVVTRDGVLYLAGPTPRAALQAVYTFLQDTLGARWYWPGESGEYLPSQKTVSTGTLDIRQLPSLTDRSLSINSPHWDEETVVWMARNRLNWHHLQGSTITHEHINFLHEKGLQVVIGGHNITLDKKLLEEHPEYLAMYGGKRQFPTGVAPHLCWSNAGVQDAVTKKIEKWWDDNPTVDSVSFLAADQTHFCECDQCKAMAPDVSTRWQKFCRIIIERVNKTHPGKHYQALAYQAYRNVPTEVAPFDLIGYTTYNINYTKPITDPSNAKARAEIEAWQKLGAPMGIRGYQFIPFRERMFAPITSLIVDEVAWAHKIGLRGWKSEVTPFGHPRKTAPPDQNWVTNRMALYAVAQAMWNAQIQPSAIMQDWSQHVFGPAAAPMQEYYAMMDDAWRSNPKSLSYFLQPAASFAGSFLSDELLKKAGADFQQARAALNAVPDEAEKERIAAQINLEAAMLNNWRRVYLLQQGRAQRLQAYAARAAQTPPMKATADDATWKTAASLPEFEDGDGQPATERTQVLALWDDDALYLRFIAHDNDIRQLKTTDAAHDANIFGDDAIELFLDDPSAPGHYFHLVANARGARYDAKADGAMNFDKAWNPDWTAKTSLLDDRWILDVKLPFAAFGISAQEGAQWKMSFKRSGARRRANSGWPDASYHNPAGFGTIHFVQKAPQSKRVLLYGAGRKSDALRAELAKLGFAVRDEASDDAEMTGALAAGAEAITLLHPSTGGFALSAEFMRDRVLPFLQRGGLVLVAGNGNIPLDKWFGEDAKVQWSGWKIDTNRRTVTHRDGDWLRRPNDISRAIASGVTPASGFKPLSDKWEVLATMRMKDGTEMPYLLRLKVGEGTLILTSSNFAYGGGFEMFGSQNPGNAAKLVDNLLANP